MSTRAQADAALAELRTVLNGLADPAQVSRAQHLIATLETALDERSDELREVRRAANFERIRRSAASLSGGVWQLVHDQPDGENVVVSLDATGAPAQFIAAFDEAADARFLIDAHTHAVAVAGDSYI